MHEFIFLAGSNFDRGGDKNGMINKIIVNREFLKVLDLKSPNEAIGQHFWFNNQQLTIIGVVEDFITTSLVWEVDKKYGFVYGQLNDHGILGVKISGNDVFNTMQKLEEKFELIDPLHPFDADFYSQQIGVAYREFKSTYTVVTFLSIIAISISTLGLLGMAVFKVETSMKEICIRKVMGAGTKSLSLRLSRSFIGLMLIAAVISIPVTWYVMDQFILSQFLYRANLGIGDLLSGVSIVLIIGIITVGWQVRKAVIQNPSYALRDE